MDRTIVSTVWALAASALLIGCGAGEEAPGVPEASSTAPDATSDPTAPPTPELPFVARGNEPFWRVEIDSASLTFRPMDGEPRVSAWRIEADAEPVRYLSADADRPLSITVLDRVCRDTMSGMPYPFEVVLDVDGEALRGCGGAPRALLVGAEWAVTEIDGAPVLEGSAPTLRFDAEGTASGDASCNRFTGGYTLSGEGLTFSPFGVTRRACAEPLMAQEGRYLDVLARVARFGVADDGALLLEADDARRVRLER